MECNQIRTQRGCYALTLNRTCSREETMETIVPDACPDIARILDTTGVCRLNRRELTENGLLLSGTIQTVTLYVPEGEGGVCRLESSVPFQHLHECGKIEGEARLMAGAWVSAADTRAVNPRKVLLRLDVTEQLRLYVRRTLSPCSDLEADPALGVQLRLNRYQSVINAGTGEKRFVLQDEFPLNPLHRGGCELLRLLPAVQCSESRLMGGKLVLKGALTAQLLLRGGDGTLFTTATELPFSQMLDAPEMEGDGEAQVEVQLTEWSCGTLSEDARSLPVQAEVLVTALFRERVQLQVLTDLYSTRYPAQLQWEELSLNQCSVQTQRLPVREQINVGESVQAVCGCHTQFGAVTAAREGEQTRLRLHANAAVLYQSEDGGVGCVHHSFEVEALTQSGPGESCLTDVLPGPVEALISAAGVELRGSVELRMVCLQESSVSAVKSVRIDEAQPLSQTGQPSVVLCRAAAGEGVWELAKRYHSTCDRILAANGLTEELPERGQMLLVPRQRQEVCK